MEEYLKKIEPYSTLKMKLTDCNDTGTSIRINLDGNRNDKDTMFAGSIYSVMVLTGWTLAKHICDFRKSDYDVVIKESTSKFIKPANSSCIAKAILTVDPIQKANDNLSINVKVELLDKNHEKCAELLGNYIGIIKISHNDQD